VSREDIVWIFIFMAMFLVGVSVIVKQAEDKNQNAEPQNNYVEPLKTKYTEEAYTLEDGTLCTIIRGSLYSKISSITCNYNKHRIGGE
jgi:hypothetical protein